MRRFLRGWRLVVTMVAVVVVGLVSVLVWTVVHPSGVLNGGIVFGADSEVGPGEISLAIAGPLEWLAPATVTITGVQLVPVPGYPLPRIVWATIEVPLEPIYDVGGTQHAEPLVGARLSGNTDSAGDVNVYMKMTTGSRSVDLVAAARVVYRYDGHSFSVLVASGAILCFGPHSFCSAREGSLFASIEATQTRLGLKP
jgi:hypothetical protein